MKRFFRYKTATPVDPLIDRVMEEMHTKGVDSDEYAVQLSYLERLNDIKAKDRQDPVSRDTMALCATNLLGILLIVAYEQKHVMRSASLSQLLRPRTSTHPNP